MEIPILYLPDMRKTVRLICVEDQCPVRYNSKYAESLRLKRQAGKKEYYDWYCYSAWQDLLFGPGADN